MAQPVRSNGSQLAFSPQVQRPNGALPVAPGMSVQGPGVPIASGRVVPYEIDALSQFP